MLQQLLFLEKYKSSPVNQPSRHIDLWTTAVANFLVAFNAYWHNNMFCLAANDSLTTTMKGLTQSKQMLERLQELDNAWMVGVNIHFEQSMRFSNLMFEGCTSVFRVVHPFLGF